jgi:hypothetical protein
MKKISRSSFALALGVFLSLFPSISTSQDIEKLKSAREVARKLREEYPGWDKGLDVCPCTKSEAEKSNNFESGNLVARTSTETFILPKYHPGASFEFRSAANRVKPFSSPENPNAPKLMPGQQCTYDDAGNLITHGPGAGTPDAYSPSVTYPGQGLIDNNSHTYWDVDPVDNGLTWREYQNTWTPNKGIINGVSCSAKRVPNKCAQTLNSLGINNPTLSSNSIDEIKFYPSPYAPYQFPNHYGLGGQQVEVLKKEDGINTTWYYARYKSGLYHPGICGWVKKEFLNFEILNFKPTVQDMEASIIALRQQNPDVFKRVVKSINENYGKNTLETFNQAKEIIHVEWQKLDFDMGENLTSALSSVNGNMFIGGLSTRESLAEEKKFQEIVLKLFIAQSKNDTP